MGIGSDVCGRLAGFRETRLCCVGLFRRNCGEVRCALGLVGMKGGLVGVGGGSGRLVSSHTRAGGSNFRGIGC